MDSEPAKHNTPGPDTAWHNSTRGAAPLDRPGFSRKLISRMRNEKRVLAVSTRSPVPWWGPAAAPLLSLDWWPTCGPSRVGERWGHLTVFFNAVAPAWPRDPFFLCWTDQQQQQRRAHIWTRFHNANDLEVGAFRGLLQEMVGANVFLLLDTLKMVILHNNHKGLRANK
jgi:hypothetical protein